MKTNAKKRMLVSSVAMLLVAMLALGTATFAWFTTNTTSHADQIHATTSKVSTLVVSKSDKNWSTHVQYGVGTSADDLKIMYPASSVNGTNWWKGNAKDGTGVIDLGTEEAPITLTSATGDPDFIFTEELNVKNDGQLSVKSITIKFTGLASSSDYARVALVPKGDAGNTDVKTTDGTFGDAKTIFAKDAEEYYPINAAGTAVSGTKFTCDATCTVDVPELGPGEMAFYDLYVWFEGQDKDCKNANSGQKIPNLDFVVEGTPYDPAAAGE